MSMRKKSQLSQETRGDGCYLSMRENTQVEVVMMEYTKGDWKAGNTDVTANSKHIANCYYESLNFKRPTLGEALANANLIASAPDLYEACKLALDFFVEYDIQNKVISRLSQRQYYLRVI